MIQASMKMQNLDREPNGAEEFVFLLHGLAAHRIVMARLTSHLKRCGYTVKNWGYPSIRSPIRDHAESLRNDVRQVAEDPSVSRIHFVTHSMGSIITRCALLDERFSKLARIVMLGPPNHGSHVARTLSGPLGWFCPPLRELSDAEGSFVNRLNEPEDLEIGVIAAGADLMVPRESTYLSCQREHIVIPGHHGVLPWKHETAVCVENFLRSGAFSQRA